MVDEFGLSKKTSNIIMWCKKVCNHIKPISNAKDFDGIRLEDCHWKKSEHEIIFSIMLKKWFQKKSYCERFNITRIY